MQRFAVIYVAVANHFVIPLMNCIGSRKQHPTPSHSVIKCIITSCSGSSFDFATN